MMKLTDLNIDCLENILEYLKFGDLLSAASSNKRLNKAAIYILIRKSWHEWVRFSNVRLLRKRLIKFEKYWIEISDLKTSLQYLRCFGHLISEIEFISSKNKQFVLEQHVINYISKYGSNSLTEIIIKNSIKGWKHINKPFPKVIKVTLEECHVSDTKNSINRLFPKMLNLHNRGREKSFLVYPNHYPNLEELYILDYKQPLSKLCVETLSKNLRLNPQLEHVCISTSQPLLDSIKFQNALESLKNLKSLFFIVKTLSTRTIDREICLKNVGWFEIDFDGSSIMKIPFKFDQLEKISIKFKGRLNPEFFSFIDKYPTVKSLQLISNNLKLTVKDLSTIAKSLPSLTSVSSIGCKISTNEAIDFMNKMQSLNNFYVNLNETSDYDDFRARLGNEWECEITETGRIYAIRERDLVPKAKKRKIN